MQSKIVKSLLGLVLIVTASFSLAQSLTLGAATDSDLRPSALASAPAMVLANERRENVAFSWQVTADQARHADSAPHIARSQSYQRTVSGANLAKGVTLATTAPGALIRLSSSDRSVTLDLDRLTLTLASGRSLSARAASDQLVNGDDLRAAGWAADPQSVGLRLAPELGAGNVTLTSTAGIAADASVLIDVFDRNSELVLSVQSAAEQFFSGSRPAARVALTQAGDASPWRRASGVVIAPDGQRYAAHMTQADGEAVVQTKAPVSATTGLWEWHIAVTSKDGVERNARTAFALAYPVARFDNSVTMQRDAGVLRVELGAEVQSAGRYEARATLLATDAAGQSQAVMVGAVARWLEAGSDVLTLEFDTAQLKRLGLGEPFTIEDLQLTDQSRMGVLETRRAGVTF